VYFVLAFLNLTEDFAGGLELYATSAHPRLLEVTTIMSTKRRGHVCHALKFQGDCWSRTHQGCLTSQVVLAKRMPGLHPGGSQLQLQQVHLYTSFDLDAECLILILTMLYTLKARGSSRIIIILCPAVGHRLMLITPSIPGRRDRGDQDH
jgi:hypothetical protein